MAFGVQKLRFVYKYLIVNLQNCILHYKVASRFATQQNIIFFLVVFANTNRKTENIYRNTIKSCCKTIEVVVLYAQQHGML